MNPKCFGINPTMDRLRCRFFCRHKTLVRCYDEWIKQQCCDAETEQDSSNIKTGDWENESWNIYLL